MVMVSVLRTLLAMCITNRFHLAVHVYYDNAQMTSSLMSVMLSLDKASLWHLTHTAKWNIFVLYIVIYLFIYLCQCDPVTDKTDSIIRRSHWFDISYMYKFCICKSLMFWPDIVTHTTEF